MSRPVLAVDIGGTKLAAALIDGNRVLERREAPTPDDRHPLAVVRAVRALTAPLESRATALGVAATGRVADGRVTALNARTMPGWTDFDLRAALALETNLPTHVLNDADAAAWGEAVHGAGRGVRDLVFVTVSTGIGAGFILGGHLYTTTSGVHADLGFTLAPTGEPLEFIAGGAAIDRWARERGWAFGAREVAARAERGDADADAKLTQSASLIAWKLADLRVLLGVERAVIGGGLGLSSGYVDRVSGTLALLPETYRLEVVPASLGVDAGLVGAAAWAAG